MARTFSIAGSLTQPRPQPVPAQQVSGQFQDLHRQILWVIGCRGIILFLGLNLADPLGILPENLGPFPFAPFFNILTVILTALYLSLWWSGWQLRFQLYLHMAVDLSLATLLVAYTRGIESAFVSFYLLIIIYSSFTLGKSGGTISAALSGILYAGLITGSHLEILAPGKAKIEPETLTFRIAFHALGFFSVAFLGTYLSQRLRAVEEALEQRTDSLSELQRRNERIISSIRSGLITTDLKGTIAVFNTAAEEITQRASVEVLETPVQSVIGKPLWQKLQSADLLKDSRALRHQDWISLPGGTRRFLGLSVSPLLDQSGQLIGYIISFQDLTEIKRLEEEIRLKERMAVIGRMAAGIAHEIRNPLTSMRGSVEVLASRLALPERDARLMDILIRESDRLNKFVEDFLNFARPGKFARESVDLIPLLRDTVTLLQNSPEARDKHSIRMEVEAPEVPVWGNPDQIRQVFWNLAHNALRAMPGEGELIITAAGADDGGAQVLFRDTGVGMTEEEKDQLFQPFQSGFSGGVGLGLSIVLQIMEDHGGKILFTSEKGYGTTVTLYFPPEAFAAKRNYIM